MDEGGHLLFLTAPCSRATYMRKPLTLSIVVSMAVSLRIFSFLILSFRIRLV
jgi:hypothetical protein